jgi:oxygen tolerance protein BatD
MARTSPLPAILLLLMSSAAIAEDEPKVRSMLTRQQIYWGQSVEYVIRVSNATDSVEPDLRGLDDFSVVSLGSRSSQSSNMTIINGQVRQTATRSTDFQYRLTPSKTGKLVIPAPVVKVDGQDLVGQEQVLEVLAPDEQDVVLMEITSDRSAVYPMQPFTVTLSVVVKGLPEPLSEGSPLAVQSGRAGPPSLSIPWAPQGRTDRFPKGLIPEEDPERWLTRLLDQSGLGFRLNYKARDSIMSIFGERPLTFQPKPRQVSKKDASGRDTLYWQYDFSRSFVPEKVADYTFGPAILKGIFGTRINESGGLTGEEIYAVAKPIVVTVKDVPLDGRPDSYLGLVGTFRAGVELEPKESKVGDPITLSIELSGTGTFANAITPDLKRIPEIADHFKVYEATEEIKKNRCRFTYGLRPQEAGIEEFPSIPLSYFDVETERYVTLNTEAIPVRIIKTDHLSDDQIVSAGRGPSAAASELEARPEGIFANITDPAEVRNERVRPERWLLALVGMAGLYACVSLVTVRLQRIAGDGSIVRRRGAASKANRRLSEALLQIDQGRIVEGADLVQSAVVGLVADVTDLPEAGMTPRDVDSRLNELAVEDDLRRRVADLLETCDATRYGATGRSGQLGQDAGIVLDEVIRAMKAGRRFR